MIQRNRATGQPKSRPPVDFDNDVQYRTPAAWRNVKKAMGRQYGLDALFREFEKKARGLTGCPRMLLAAAVRAFLEADEAGQHRALAVRDWAGGTGYSRAEARRAWGRLSLMPMPGGVYAHGTEVAASMATDEDDRPTRLTVNTGQPFEDILAGVWESGWVASSQHLASDVDRHEKHRREAGGGEA